MDTEEPCSKLTPIREPELPLKKQFRLWRASKILMGLYLVGALALATLFLVVGIVTQGADMVLNPEMMGEMIGGFIVPVFFAAIALLLARVVGRVSHSTGNGVFLALALMLLLSTCGRVGEMSRKGEEQRHNEAVYSQLKIDQERLKSEMLQAIESDDGFVSGLAMFQGWVNAIEQAANSAQGEDAALYSAVASVLKTIEPHKMESEQAWSAFIDAGGNDPVDIESIEDLEHRIDLARKIKDAVVGLNDAIRKFDYVFRMQIRIKGVSPSHSRDVLLEFRKNVPIWLQISEADERFAELSLEVLKFLKDSWGRWEVDQIDGSIVVEDEVSIEQYTRLIDEMTGLIEQQEELLLRMNMK